MPGMAHERYPKNKKLQISPQASQLTLTNTRPHSAGQPSAPLTQVDRQMCMAVNLVLRRGAPSAVLLVFGLSVIDCNAARRVFCECREW